MWKPEILPEDWPTANSPPPADMTWFQKKLDRIFGVEIDGKSRFILGWGQDLNVCREWDPYGMQWRAMFPLYSTKRLTTWLPPGKSILEARFEIDDVGWPRWAILRYIPPQVACIGWKVVGVDQDGDSFYDPMPANGLYEPLFDSILADHTPWCCEDHTARQLPCLGTYRLPDEEDLEAIREIKRAQDQARERRPGRMTGREYEAALVRSQQDYEKFWGNLSDEVGKIYTEALDTHSPTLSGDPTTQHWGKYHFTRAHTKSGLVNPSGEPIEHSSN